MGAHFLLQQILLQSPNTHHGKLVSNDLYFYNVDDCTYFARALHKQAGQITAYCLPKQINPDKVKVY